MLKSLFPVVTAAPPTGRNPITAAISTRSHSPINDGSLDHFKEPSVDPGRKYGYQFGT